jgi:hypothetical protein
MAFYIGGLAKLATQNFFGSSRMQAMLGTFSGFFA